MVGLKKRIIDIYKLAISQLFIETEKHFKRVWVFNAQGEMLRNENNFTEQFGIDGLPKGIYSLKIKLSEKGFFFRKRLKKY